MKKRFQVLAQTAKCLITRCARHLGFIIMKLQKLLEIQVFLADKSQFLLTCILKYLNGKKVLRGKILTQNVSRGQILTDIFM